MFPHVVLKDWRKQVAIFHDLRRQGSRFRLENADTSSWLAGIMIILALLTIFLTTRERPVQPPVSAVQSDMTQATPTKAPL